MSRILQYDGYGIQTFLVGILDGIARIQTEHEIILLIEDNQNLSHFPFVDKFEIVEIGAATDSLISKFWWDNFKVGQTCKRLGVDALYAPAHVRPFYSPCPTAVLIHDMMYHLFPQEWSWSDRIYFCKVSPKFVIRADAIFANSINTQKDILNFLKIDDQSIQVLYPGVPAGFDPRDASEVDVIREKYSLYKPFILYVGSFHPRKNVMAVINAFDQIADDYPHDLVIGGLPKRQDQLILDRINEVAFGSRIRQIGFVPQDELPLFYSGAEIFVFPSYYEGFGLPVLEAMACGCPTITSNLSSLPEVAGDAAMLVQPDDLDALCAAMKQILDNHAFSDNLQQRSLERAKEFSWIKAANQVIDTLEMIASQ
jgi:glycosyltransferase involved in cell wall biosynthesis